MSDADDLHSARNKEPNGTPNEDPDEDPNEDPNYAPAGLILPGFVVAEADGVYADLAEMPASEAFHHAVDQLFILGAYFRGLDYPRFLELAYDLEPGVLQDRIAALTAAGKPPRLRFAERIERMDPERVSLYRPVKISGGKATYLFEPLVLQREHEIPVIEEDENGIPEVVRMEVETFEVPTRLNFDEFVAQMWLKGLRYGIEEAEVRRVIAKGLAEGVVVAKSLQPTKGKDAGVKELHDGLHRDDAPQTLSDGRVDLTQFRNRFPQIKAGTRLLEKTPRELGALGRELSGRPLPPGVPKDFELADLVGEGTRIERDGLGEYLVATIDGFLDIDAQTNRLSVSEKIVNRDGVSLRTTGDLQLLGDEYEEHGEIQERRVVRGRSITTHADVFGELESSGGTITIKKNLSGGSARNQHGPVIIEGMAVNAQVHAVNGEIRIKRGEGCTLIGQKVVAELLINCDVLADEAEITECAGAAIAARQVHINRTRQKRGEGNLVNLLLPDVRAFDEALRKAQAGIAELQNTQSALNAQLAALRSDPDAARYLGLLSSVKAGKVSLNDAQKNALQQMAVQVAPTLKKFAALGEEARRLSIQLEEARSEQERIVAEREQSCAGIGCWVEDIEGELLVRGKRQTAETALLFTLPPGDLKARLRALDDRDQRIAAASGGQLGWEFSAPPLPDIDAR